MRLLYTFFPPALPALCTLSERIFVYHRPASPDPLPSAESGSQNVWRVTCRHRVLACCPSHLSLHRLSYSEMTEPPPKGPCRLFRSKEGCRYGKKCKFSHDLGSTSTARTTPQPPGKNTPSSSTPATPRNRSGRSGNAAPRDVCGFYWDSGQCKRGFDCTFRHQKNTNSRSGAADAGRVEDEEDAANTALEFFTTNNLTQMAGVELLRIQEGTPENAHNLIKRYLGGGTLNNPADMKQLISVLASVNRRNHSWVCVIPPFASDGR